MKMKTALFLMFSILLTVPAFAESENLFQKYDGKSVKVYIAPAKDSTSGHDIDPASLKTKIEEALKARKSIRFQIVDSAEAADLSIDTNLIGYVWSDHDPIDMLVGVGGTAADAAIVEDYASAEADITVTDVRSNRPVWVSRVRASVTKKPMSRAESVPLVSDQMAKTFIKECFSKRSKRR